MKHSKFLIICNSRSGSTWLSTALNQINGVSTDYEIKIPPVPFDMLDFHYELTPDFDTTFWKKFTSHYVGTKLVFDLRKHGVDEFKTIAMSLPKDIKLIYLKRSLVDQSISEFKTGWVNHLVDNHINTESEIFNQLKHETQHVQVNATRNHISKDMIATIHKNILLRLSIEIFISKYLTECLNEFICVDYERLPEQFPQLLEFLEIDKNIELSTLSITKKLNKNYTELEQKIRRDFSIYDKVRDHFSSTEAIPFELIDSFVSRYP